jgi:phosphoglycolate phosphatase-like HAD superfamily hydrolase
MVGDRTVDIQAGRDAGCRTILVRTGYGGRDAKCAVTADAECDDLCDAARHILKSLR